MKPLEILEVVNFLLVKEHGGALPVLIVDDDDNLGKLAAIYLSEIGVKSERHLTLKGARQALGERKFGLILLDINFPVGDGLEFWEWLQTEPELHNLPVVILSGMTIWVSTKRGPRKFADAGAKELMPGNFWMFIPKGTSGLETAIQRAAKLLGMSQTQARRIAVVRLLQSTGWAVLGFGLHAGWWVELVVTVCKLFK